MNEFFEKHRAFTTTMAKQNGYSRKALRSDPNVVALGTFPVRNKAGKITMEKVYTYSPKLAELVKQGKRIARKGQESPQATEIVDQIEKLVKETLGFNDEGEPNDEQDHGCECGSSCGAGCEEEGHIQEEDSKENDSE